MSGPGHGAPRPVPIEAALADDPELWLTTADPHVWSEAHPCACPALCACDEVKT